jgi:hypothetical protein
MQMQKQSWRDRTQPWIGFAFCAFLSVTTLGVLIAERFQASALIPFLSGLPMCFFFAAVPLILMRKEIAELRGRLDKIEGR